MNTLFESENLEVYQDEAGEIKYSYASAPEAMGDLYECIVGLTEYTEELNRKVEHYKKGADADSVRIAQLEKHLDAAMRLATNLEQVIEDHIQIET